MQGRVRALLLCTSVCAFGVLQWPSFAAEGDATAASPKSATIANSPSRGYTIVRVKRVHSLLLHASPGGRAIKRVGSFTEFGSRRLLSVAAVESDWLGLTTVARPNGRLAWINRHSDDITYEKTMYSLHADLSARRLDLLHGKRVMRRIRVAVGRPGSSTPTGRFAITDKLSGRANGAYYGCCILALSGHQPHLPAGWHGGNRLAIHGTNAPSTIGRAASAGCLRAADRDLRVLMKRVPLGTPVFIRR